MAVEKLGPIRKFFSNGVNKKSIFYFGIVILVALISLFIIYHFSKIPEVKETPLPEKPISKEEETIKKQLEELEKLRTETPTLTEKEIQTQLKELEKLKGKQKSLSEEEIKKQLEELNKLRGE